jgi:ribosomal protein S18 acetylase RimI-like enzyme
VFSRSLPDRAAILDAVSHHPYARFIAGMSSDMRGIAVNADGAHPAVLWWGDSPLGRLGHGIGDPACLDVAVAQARDKGGLNGVVRINLPRRTEIPPGWVINEQWDYCWLPAPDATVPKQPHQDAVRPEADAEAIAALLDVAFPESMLRPGHPMVNEWYGARAGGVLVACAADRSVRSPESDAVPTGVLGAVAVHPDHRGHGWGAAVTAALASALTQRYAQVGLGVTAHNRPAQRLYARLGFTGRHEMTSIRPAPRSVKKGTLYR